MFAQRFVHIFYPMHYAKVNKVFRILNDTRQLILLTGIMSFGSQVILYLNVKVKNFLFFSFGHRFLCVKFLFIALKV